MQNRLTTLKYLTCFTYSTPTVSNYWQSLILSVVSFLECHINENIQHVAFQTFSHLAICFQTHPCLCMTRLIHCFLSVDNISLYWWPKVYWFTYGSTSWLPKLLVIMNKGAVNIHIQIFSQIRVFKWFL